MFTRSFIRAGVAALLVVGAAACGTDAPDGARTAGVGGQLPQPRAAASTTEAEISPGDTVEFVATEFAFAPSDVDGRRRAPTPARSSTTGTIEHDITFDNGEAIVAAAGESVEFEFEVPEEGVRYLCSIPGHEDAGMDGIVSTRHRRRRPSSAAPMNHGDRR